MMILPTAGSCIGRASMSSPPPPSDIGRKRRISIGTFQQLLTIAPSQAHGDNHFYSDFVNSASSNTNDCIGALTSAASTVVSSGKWAVNAMIKAATPSRTPSPTPIHQVATTMATSTTSTIVITGAQSNIARHFPTEDRFADIEANIDSMVPGSSAEHRRSMRRLSSCSSSLQVAPPTAMKPPIRPVAKSTTITTPLEIDAPTAAAASKKAKNSFVDYDDSVFEEPTSPQHFFHRGCPSRRTVMVTADGRVAQTMPTSLFGTIMNSSCRHRIRSVVTPSQASFVEQPLANIANNSPSAFSPSVSKKAVLMSLVARKSLQATIV